MSIHINLQFRRESGSLQEIADILDFSISRIWIAGTPRKTLQNAPLDGNYQESYLSLKITPHPGKISGAIEDIRKSFQSLSKEMMQKISDPSLRKSLYCTLDGNGEELGIHSLKVLTEYEIELHID